MSRRLPCKEFSELAASMVHPTNFLRKKLWATVSLKLLTIFCDENWLYLSQIQNTFIHVTSFTHLWLPSCQHLNTAKSKAAWLSPASAARGGQHHTTWSGAQQNNAIWQNAPLRGWLTDLCWCSCWAGSLSSDGVFDEITDWLKEGKYSCISHTSRLSSDLPALYPDWRVHMFSWTFLGMVFLALFLNTFCFKTLCFFSLV